MKTFITLLLLALLGVTAFTATMRQQDQVATPADEAQPDESEDMISEGVVDDSQELVQDTPDESEMISEGEVEDSDEGADSYNPEDEMIEEDDEDYYDDDEDDATTPADEEDDSAVDGAEVPEQDGGVLAESNDPKEIRMSEHITFLSTKNFARKVSKIDPWFIMFYSPRCPHSIAALPVWSEFSDSMANLGVGIIDCDENRGTCDNFGIEGYPTFMLLIDDHMFEYTGRRSVYGFQQFTVGGYKNTNALDLPVW